MRLVLLGPPGAGKGTQSVRIAEAYGVPHIATGDIFRDNIGNATALGLEARTYMDRGNLVPDETVNRMVADRLAMDDCRKGFLLDGFPRTLPQAHELEGLLAGLGEPLSGVLRFEVPEDELFQRIEGRAREEGRTDDSAEVLRNRLAEYRMKTAPLEDFYVSRGLLHDVDAVGTMDEVFERAVKVLRDLGHEPSSEPGEGSAA